ncbi:MAG: Ig-like domain-containing protein [Gemmataceae bacterium]
MSDKGLENTEREQYTGTLPDSEIASMPSQRIGERQHHRCLGSLGWSVLGLVVAGIFLSSGYVRFGSFEKALAYLNGQRVFVRPDVINFGEGRTGEIREGTVTVTNYLSNELRIIGSTSTCECVATERFPVVVPPGQSYDLAVKVGYSTRAGDFEQNLSFYTDSDYLPRFQVSVRGSVMNHTGSTSGKLK